VWFGFAPFATTIGDELGLGKAELLTLGLCNVALTVPARVFVGMALDRFGPRRVYASILVFALVPSMLFATAHSFEQLVIARLLVSLVGAGFVVGIRLVSEWFASDEVGTAEGVYGGWGNFGAAAAAFGLPAVAAAIGGPAGWRWAAAGIGVGCAVYGLAYLRLVTDTPDGHDYERPRTVAALEVTSRSAVFGLAAMLVPLSAALGLIAYRIWDTDVVSTPIVLGSLVLVGALLAYQEIAVFRVNRSALARTPAADPYPFRSVAVLAFAYFCTFGSEVAAVSFLPQFFEDTWELGPEVAGFAAAGFAVMNLVTRPAGGLLSDVLGSRRRWLAILLAGLAVGFVAMSRLDGQWPLAAALVLVVVTSLFAQAGNGAVYAIVPLIRPRAGGQIAGIVGAYGNVGGVVFLSTLTIVEPSAFFLVMAGCAGVACLACRAMVEPRGKHAADARPVPAPRPVASPVLAGTGRLGALGAAT
jgi:NNP family nitrate/nitrite transporter-like MFS transporter